MCNGQSCSQGCFGGVVSRERFSNPGSTLQARIMAINEPRKHRELERSSSLHHKWSYDAPVSTHKEWKASQGEERDSNPASISGKKMEAGDTHRLI